MARGLKEGIKLMMLTRPQSQFFEDELKITAADTITMKGINKSNNISKEVCR